MNQQRTAFRFPKPGKALLWTMVALGCIWVMFAVALNWAGGGQGLWDALTVKPDRVFQGQVWRLLTGAVLHIPGSVWHVFSVILLLYFLGAPLEKRWGAKRFLLFLAGSAVFAFVVQIIAGLLFKAVAEPVYFGGIGMAEAVCIAWAMGSRQGKVFLFFVLPVTPKIMVGFMLVMNIVNLIARSGNPEGLITPFAGMLAGYLFSEGSPLRRLYLQLKLKKLQAEVTALQRKKPRTKRRRGGPKLRVIDGGNDKKPPDKPVLH